MTDYKDRVSGCATDIDWSKAPEGFPIWIEDLNPGKGFDCSGWHRDDGDRYTDEDGKYWTKSEEGIYRVHSPAPQWNGEGLPPVGAVCEHEGTESAREPWIEVEILAHAQVRGFDVAVFQYGDTISYSTARHFRPIKTPAQIAAEEREAAVRELAGAIMGHAIGCRLPMSESGAERLADHLMMDGYTKTKGDDK